MIYDIIFFQKKYSFRFCRKKKENNMILFGPEIARRKLINTHISLILRFKIPPESLYLNFTALKISHDFLSIFTLL